MDQTFIQATNIAISELEALAIDYIMKTLTAKLWGLSLF